MDCIFLSNTKASEEKMERLCLQLGFTNYVMSAVVGLAEGTVFMRKEN